MENDFSPFVRILGKGKAGSRSLSEQEAFDAMSLILSGRAEPVQLGAFLMLLRVKEETAEELAGFAQACRAYIDRESVADCQSRNVNVDLDWSSYAGKRRQPHWFLLAALLLAHSGFTVLMHGTRGHTEGRIYTEDIAIELGLPVADSMENANAELKSGGFAYLPLANFCEPLQSIIDLRPLFGLRSPVHTLCRLINPMSASASLQSVFHPSYLQSHHHAASLLGEKSAIVLKGDAGEVEYRPHASVRMMQLAGSETIEKILPRLATPPEDLKPGAAALRELWQTDTGQIEKSYGYKAVIGTAAVGLMAMQKVTEFGDGFDLAEALWNKRDPGVLS